jgi:hypothetical protein
VDEVLGFSLSAFAAVLAVNSLSSSCKQTAGEMKSRRAGRESVVIARAMLSSFRQWKSHQTPDEFNATLLQVASLLPTSDNI